MARKVVLVEQGCSACESIEKIEDGVMVYDIATEEGKKIAMDFVRRGLDLKFVPSCVIDDETGLRFCTTNEYHSTIKFKEV